MVTPGKTELPGRCAGLLQLWQDVFPKVYTAWVAKIKSLCEFLYQRAEFRAGGMTGNLGWVTLGTNLTTERLNLPPSLPHHPQSDCHVYPSLYLPAELHRLREMLGRGCCKSAAEQRHWLLHGEGESDFSMGPSKFASLSRTTTKSLEK